MNEHSESVPENETQEAQAILASMQEAVVYSDLKGVIRLWNRGAEQVFGFSAQEAVGQSVDIIIPEKLRKAHWAGFNKAVEHGDILSPPGSRMTKALTKSGETIYVDMSFAMVRNRAGEMTGSIAVARDATARYMAERAARLAASNAAPGAA